MAMKHASLLIRIWWWYDEEDDYDDALYFGILQTHSAGFILRTHVIKYMYKSLSIVKMSWVKDGIAWELNAWSAGKKEESVS